MTISQRRWQDYENWRKKGYSVRESADRIGIAYNTASQRETRFRKRNNGIVPWDPKTQRVKNEHNRATKHERGFVDTTAGEPVPKDQLCDEAKRALQDFAYFRRRYFGRLSTPWQEEAGYRCVEMLESKRKEYVVVNCPPGSGKSTLFPLDLAAWITCRNRGIRGMIGSASQPLAERYLLRLRNALENPFPVKGESEEMELGLAFDAEATLRQDFGAFKPEGHGGLWSQHAFIVMQHDNRSITEKEPTWSAYGLDTAFIGGRFDVAIWDDATEDKHLSTPDRIEKQRDRWDKVAEKRLEPGGVLVINGQRLGPEDLYRHCLDKKMGETSRINHDGCCDAEPGAKYHHIRYRAHYEDRCHEDHNPGAYYPEGCLLDPQRLPWYELESEMANNNSNFMQVYQQEDIDPAQTLVDMMWVKGGTDPNTGEFFPGCWDMQRDAWEIPPLTQPYVSVLCVDPSPTKMWGITLWVYHPGSEVRFLVALDNHKLNLGQFFDWNQAESRFTGLLPEWYLKSVECGFPISTLIFEMNAAQRFFLASEALRRWQQETGVRIIGHETHARNKLDPKLGPQILAGLYRRGLVRLPSGSMYSRAFSLKLVDEVTKWPVGRTDDLVMSSWFLESNIDKVYAKVPPMRRTWRPTWMREGVPA